MPGTYKRRSVYGKTWDEAHEKLTKLKADSLNGLPVATNKMTIAEYLVASVFLIEFSAKAALQYRLDVAFALLAAAAWVTRLISARSRRQQFAAAAAR